MKVNKVSGSEDDGIDEGDDEIEEESEPELPVKIETVKKIYAQVPLVAKEPERQLSKKELKKKELAELEAVLAALGIPKKQNCRQDEVHGVTQENKSEELNGDMEKKENVPTESKNMKKKKKKDKSLKVVNGQDHHNGSEIVNNGQDEAGGIEEADVKERLKKLASAKKKKPNKEMDTPAKAAAVEAAARRAKLAAAKKKEKNHYNQQPVRILEGNHSTGYHAAKVVSAIENYDHGADEPRINPVNSRYNLSIEFSRPACPVLIQNGVLANPLGSP
ncbi:hypothetical protein GIB67_020523 [Kingdonia uniflora]|uniref:Uncharacterized protein n=1 Tax=Kingdonia uniflora TaxID=39325 RepID=A0A7J7NLH9_9MAGN|nr:hypothetical protein GIB67_020523 [Kingdonia uniflora]